MGAGQAGNGDQFDRGSARRLRQTLLVSALAVFVLVSIGVVLAHWESRALGSIETGTGDVALDVNGTLGFESQGCGSDLTSAVCDKFDSDVIGSAPLSKTVGDVVFTITGWVHKAGEPSEMVGFHYTVNGGTVEIDVKSGQSHAEVTLAEGSGVWLNPACAGDPEIGGMVACNPANTSAISFVGFCVEVGEQATCPPGVSQVAVSNVGSIPFELTLSLTNSGDTDYCGSFDLVIRRSSPNSGNDPPTYEGPLCALLVTALPLEIQLNPGESAQYELSLTYSDSGLNGTAAEFTARFEATQWNEPNGWSALIDVPLTISVGEPSSQRVISRSLPNQISTPDVAEERGPTAEEEPLMDPKPEDPPYETKPVPGRAALTGFVWLDEDGNGVRADSEPGLPGSLVRLFGGGVEISSTTTDSVGAYSFLDLTVGEFTIEIEVPEGHVFTTPHQGVDPSLDSDVVEVGHVDGLLLGRLEASLDPDLNLGVADAGVIPSAVSEGG